MEKINTPEVNEPEQTKYEAVGKNRLLHKLCSFFSIRKRASDINVIRQEKQARIEEILKKSANHPDCQQQVSKKDLSTIEVALSGYSAEEVEKFQKSFPNLFINSSLEFSGSEKLAANALLNQIRTNPVFEQENEVENAIKKFEQLQEYLENNNFSVAEKSDYLYTGKTELEKVIGKYFGFLHRSFTNDVESKSKKFKESITDFANKNPDFLDTIADKQLKQFILGTYTIND